MKAGQFFDKVKISNYPIIKDDSKTELRYTQKAQGYIICLILTFSHNNPIRKIRLYILCLKIFQLFFLILHNQLYANKCFFPQNKDVTTCPLKIT